MRTVIATSDTHMATSYVPSSTTSGTETGVPSAKTYFRQSERMSEGAWGRGHAEPLLKHKCIRPVVYRL